jgi:hypothetical protein
MKKIIFSLSFLISVLSMTAQTGNVPKAQLAGASTDTSIQAKKNAEMSKDKVHEAKLSGTVSVTSSKNEAKSADNTPKSALFEAKPTSGQPK